MSEKRFLSFILTEGIISVVLGLILLILPKITDITFGLLLSLVMIIFGGYHSITSFISRNFDSHYILNIISGLILLTAGILLFFAPIVEMIVIVLLIGLYFILESISSSIFALQTINIFYFWKAKLFVALIQLFFGLMLIILFSSLWLAGIFIGADMIICGIVLLNMYYSKKYVQ